MSEAQPKPSTKGCWVALLAGTIVLIAVCSVWANNTWTNLGQAGAGSKEQLLFFDCPVTDDEYQYLHDMKLALEYVFQAYRELAPLLRATQTNPDLMVNEGWKQELGDWLVRFVAEAKIIRSLEPPKSVLYIQASANLLADDLDIAAIEIAEGVDGLNQRRLDKGKVAYVTGEAHLNRTSRNIDGYCGRARNNLPPALSVP